MRFLHLGRIPKDRRAIADQQEIDGNCEGKEVRRRSTRNV
jgi:hypothetical protein